MFARRYYKLQVSLTLIVEFGWLGLNRLICIAAAAWRECGLSIGPWDFCPLIMMMVTVVRMLITREMVRSHFHRNFLIMVLSLLLRRGLRINLISFILRTGCNHFFMLHNLRVWWSCPLLLPCLLGSHIIIVRDLVSRLPTHTAIGLPLLLALRLLALVVIHRNRFLMLGHWVHWRDSCAAARGQLLVRLVKLLILCLVRLWLLALFLVGAVTRHSCQICLDLSLCINLTTTILLRCHRFFYLGRGLLSEELLRIRDFS